MNDLLKTKMFRLLSEFLQQVTNQEMQNAYGFFMKELRTVSQSEENNSETFRMLNTTRVELTFLNSFYRYEQGENALKLAYLQKALSLVNSERELLDLKIRYPEQFRQSCQSTFQSDLYILPKSKDLGSIALAEIVIALFLSKKVFLRNGKPAHLNQIAHAFEKVFNFSFGSTYDQQEKIFDRKQFNRTKTLDFLRNLIIRKDRGK